jgi:hypothetical protein
MGDYNDGLIHGWNSGECPVHPESVVEVWLRNDTADFTEYTAGKCRWSHLKSDQDIIAFRVVKQHVEPKTIWVNEYEDCSHTHKTEDAAKRNASSTATRIAVEYREVKK